MQPLLYSFLIETVLVLALLARSWLWTRYPLFTLMLVADLVKYALWGFYNPEIYVWTDGPATALRVLATFEVIARATEFVSDRGKWLLAGLALAVALLSASVALGARIEQNEIWDYNIARLTTHTACGFGLLLFVTWWFVLKWEPAHRVDRPHCVLLGGLCTAYGVADALSWIGETGVEVLVGFRAVRVALYYGWIRTHWPRKRLSMRPTRLNSSDSR